MVGVLIRMNLAMQRKSLNGTRLFWAGVGLLAAFGTIALSVVDRPAVAVDLLASAFAGWTLLLALAPVFSGSSGIRAEHLVLLPIPPRKLAVGLLGSALVGFSPVVALVAFVALSVYGFQFGIGPGLVGILGIVLQLIVAVLLARVVHSLMGAAMQTRLGMELVALQFAFFIAMTSVGWFAIQPIVGTTDQLLREGWPSLLSTIFRVSPSGWGIVAVDAARRTEWGLVVGVFLGFAVLIGGLILAWASLLARSTTSKPASHNLRAKSVKRSAAYHQLLPTTQIGAVISRELHSWARDPWRALEVRIALWTGLFTGAIPLLIGRTEVLPFVGITIAIMGGIGSGNLLGLDGSVLWQTLLVPGAERVDIRGRQLAWLLIFGPLSFAATVIFTLLSGENWAWPLVLSVLCAVLGGTVGLAVFFSVFFPSPGIDPRMRKNPMDSAGDAMTEVFMMPWLSALLAAPTIALVVTGMTRENLALQWAGLPVGIVTGILFGWGLGYLAIRRLESNGPELLNLLLKGSSFQAKTKGTTADKAWETLPLKKKIIVRICISLCWLPLFPQGIVPLIFKVFGIDVKSWFLALYLPSVVQWPVIIAMIALGASMLWLAIQIPRKHAQQMDKKAVLSE